MYWIFLLKHKYYVFLAGVKFSKSNLFNLIIHDWSKFTSKEYPYYRLKHYKQEVDDSKMQAAWLHHQNYNPHHWEHWIARTGHGNEGIGKREVLIEIPELYVREMVADWFGASRTYGPEHERNHWINILDWPWLKNYGIVKMKGRLHPNTIKTLDKVFGEICWKQNKVENTSLFSWYLEHF